QLPRHPVVPGQLRAPDGSGPAPGGCRRRLAQPDLPTGRSRPLAIEMLQSLRIRNLALIEAVDMRFEPGLNVLTGETGAGKSILLDALAFALGWRGRAGMVRPGAERGEVEAVFGLDPGHAAEAVLEAAGITAEGELILRRTVSADGRATAFVNDRRVAAETLRMLADGLVEIHGQHDERGLLDPRGHRMLLDAFA